MASKKEDPKKDVPRKTGLIVAVLAGLLVAALAVVFVTTAKRTSGPVTTDMALAEPAGGPDVQTSEVQAPLPSEAVPVVSEPSGLDGAVSVDSGSGSGNASSSPAGAPVIDNGFLPGEPHPSPDRLEPVPVPGGEGVPPEAGASMPGSEGSGVPMPDAPDMVPPPDMAAPPCDFPQFVGLPADDPKVDEVLKTRAHRLLPPGAMMTQDHSPARINLDLDDKGVIRRVWCG